MAVMGKPKKKTMCKHDLCWTEKCRYKHTHECQQCTNRATWWCSTCRNKGGITGYLCDEHKDTHVGQGGHGNYHKPEPKPLRE